MERGSGCVGHCVIYQCSILEDEYHPDGEEEEEDSDESEEEEEEEVEEEEGESVEESEGESIVTPAKKVQ